MKYFDWKFNWANDVACPCVSYSERSIEMTTEFEEQVVEKIEHYLKTFHLMPEIGDKLEVYLDDGTERDVLIKDIIFTFTQRQGKAHFDVKIWEEGV